MNLASSFLEHDVHFIPSSVKPLATVEEVTKFRKNKVKGQGRLGRYAHH